MWQHLQQHDAVSYVPAFQEWSLLAGDEVRDAHHAPIGKHFCHDSIIRVYNGDGTVVNRPGYGRQLC
jgi:hypothetical protein